MASKIEDMIVELQDYIDGCKSAPFKADSIVVNRDDIESYIEDLRATIPDEIRQYQRIINNQEHILADARKKADAIIKEAEIQTDQLVSQHQIMQQAYARANEVVMVASKEATSILDKANEEANEIKQGAMQYTDSQLKIVQDIMISTMEETKSKADNYITQMQRYLDVVTSNRNELAPVVYGYSSDNDNTPNEDQEVEPVKPDTNLNKASDSISSKDKPSNTSNGDNKGLDVDVPDVFFNKE